MSSTEPPKIQRSLPERQLVDFLFLLLERIWIVLILTIGGLIYAQYYLRTTTPLYEATATIEINRHLTEAVSYTHLTLPTRS